jgi:hypothetical protein
MAKNLRQKYKEAKKQLQFLRLKVFAAEIDRICTNKQLPIATVNTSKAYYIYDWNEMREALVKDLAFDLANYMVEKGMLNVVETYYPHSGRVYVTASVNVLSKDCGQDT